MSTILSFPSSPDPLGTRRRRSKSEGKEALVFTFASIGPSAANSFLDFERCLTAAIDFHSTLEERIDCYIFEGRYRKIVCIVTMNVFGSSVVDYTRAGTELLESSGHTIRTC